MFFIFFILLILGCLSVNVVLINGKFFYDFWCCYVIMNINDKYCVFLYFLNFCYIMEYVCVYVNCIVLKYVFCS